MDTGPLLTTWAVLTEFSHLAPTVEATLPLYRWIDNDALLREQRPSGGLHPGG